MPKLSAFPIRVAAETAAGPRVRVALEQVAGEEIDEPRLLRELERE